MRALSEWESKQRLGDTLPRPRETLADDAGEAVAFCETVGGPLVAKASGVAHKTEGGLVRLGVTCEAVPEVFAELATAGDGRVLLAEQLNADLELIVGGYRDDQLGPVVTVGIGGIAAELFGDLVAVLAPPEPGELAAAVEELRGSALLAGIRGGHPVDLDALEQIVAAVSRLLVDDPTVAEVDCNPVMVVDGRPLVADALVVMTA